MGVVAILSRNIQLAAPCLLNFESAVHLIDNLLFFLDIFENVVENLQLTYVFLDLSVQYFIIPTSKRFTVLKHLGSEMKIC